MSVWVALLALIIERIWGYPDRVYRLLNHPVAWMGWVIARGEGAFNKPDDTPDDAGRLIGAALLGTFLTLVLLAAHPVGRLLSAVPGGWVFEAALASSLLAQKSLGDAVARVADALRAGPVEAAREAVSHIVGRDTAELDEAEISRAAIETLAENASDGVVAPLFYLALFGLPGIAVYKAINTADSMIGHKSDRYRAFGWAAAKVDDVANYIPARLTALLIALAARWVPGAAPGAALRAARRDSVKHASPNAGWPEAAMAGALGFGLGGPRAYKGEVLDLPAMGDGRRDLGADDIDAALRLYRRLLDVLLAVSAAAAVALWLF
ncbi:adenosylcobinamide-phosphate synthase CbiB [Pelagibacterium xiamenense]|uniref:adenosylcobinamide-phosphate synthase CbiB n=1 Tax=Pelagibacterium xiamenense TaxID=2901140 RepID=UPI001E45F95A|nr:adenosylcobinamide-phosphate synthase CbiB [Pelagibacterium xiamenense]MCD7058833.1 adenosylcobinamide-phosphate synthase CbiB [Pelagibacterium xiamenense]